MGRRKARLRNMRAIGATRLAGRQVEIQETGAGILIKVVGDSIEMARGSLRGNGFDTQLLLLAHGMRTECP